MTTVIKNINSPETIQVIKGKIKKYEELIAEMLVKEIICKIKISNISLISILTVGYNIF